MKLLNGNIKVPVAKSHFGDYLKLDGLIPSECDCVMILVNTGGGLNAGFPQPVGFLKLTHQIYVKDIQELVERWHASRDNAQMLGAPDLWRVTAVPVNSKHYVDLWEAGK